MEIPEKPLGIYIPPLTPDNKYGRDSSQSNLYYHQWKALGCPEEWHIWWQNPSEMYWSPDIGWLKSITTREVLDKVRAITNGCFHHHNLQTQCALLELPFQSLSAHDLLSQISTQPTITSPMSVESLCLEYFKHQGWQGERYEGATIRLIIQSIDKHVRATVMKSYGKRTIRYKKGKKIESTYMDPDEAARMHKEIDDRYDELMAEAFNYCYPNHMDEIHHAWAKNPENWRLPSYATPENLSLNTFVDLALAVG